MKTLISLFLMSAPVAAQVTGTVTYEDKLYTSSGFTGGTSFRAVRQAEVEIVRSSDGAVLGTGATDNSGAFSIAGIPGSTSVFARVYARRAGGQINAVILNNASSNAVYAAVTATVTTNGAGAAAIPALGLTIAGGAAPAFNLFDGAVKSFQYQAGVDADLPALPPQMKVYWQSGSTNGTYFSQGSNAIFLLGASSDPDEYDDDIVLHEMGHWAAFNFSRDDSLGGAHTILDQLDPRTAWSEGWAHYWSATVRRFNAAWTGEYVAPATQVDNFGFGSSAFEIEGPSFPALTVMATNEVAVAAVLWDITDPANEAFDLLSGNELEAWQTVNNRIPPRANITLEDFRAGLALEAPGIMADVTGSEAVTRIMNARSIRYYPNTAEPNDSAATAVPLALGSAGQTLRTLFSTVLSGDEDWYSISLGPGTALLQAETLNLGDGADTFLELYGSSLTLLDSNDNRTIGDKTSLIQHPFQLAAATTFYLRVTRSGSVVENGYYDIRAQLVSNFVPAISEIRASATSGTAPFRVTLSASASDPDGSYLEYQWDFDGDGKYDGFSLAGPTVTTTYALAGSYLAVLRVVDAAGEAATQGVVITVFSDTSPSIDVSQNATGGIAPLAVSFNATVSGVIPTAYAWDFDSDGVVDSVSETSPSAIFTYRTQGSFTARLFVHDSQGRAFSATSRIITVGAGTSPPVIGGFSTVSGTVPYINTLNVTHSDTAPGVVVTVEFDTDGDGRYDVSLPAGLGSTSFSYEVQRAGRFTAKARVTDNSGLTTEATATITALESGSRAWLVDPRVGDSLSGTSVTLTGETVPAGVSKKIQFQYRRDSPPGPWTDIGGPVVTSGTLAAVSWDVSGFSDGSTFDVRLRVDDSVSSGDDSNTIDIDFSAPTVSESGSVRENTVRSRRNTVRRAANGVWVIVPNGVTLATGNPTLRIEPVSAPLANGSALGMTMRGSAVRLTVDSGFSNTFRLRIPFSGDGTELEVHRYDEAARLWRRLFFPRVSHEDGWAEADGVAAGIYALFANSLTAFDGSSRGRRCFAATASPPRASTLGLAAAILLLAFLKRR